MAPSTFPSPSLFDTASAVVMIDVRPSAGGWKASEFGHTELVFLRKPSALFCAQLRARNRRCQIRVFDARGRLEDTIAVEAKKRTKAHRAARVAPAPAAFPAPVEAPKEARKPAGAAQPSRTSTSRLVAKAPPQRRKQPVRSVRQVAQPRATKKRAQNSKRGPAKVPVGKRRTQIAAVRQTSPRPAPGTRKRSTLPTKKAAAWKPTPRRQSAGSQAVPKKLQTGRREPRKAQAQRGAEKPANSSRQCGGLARGRAVKQER